MAYRFHEPRRDVGRQGKLSRWCMARESREVWLKRVERWRESGLSVKEFARELGINAHTLAGWRWRLRAEDRSTPIRDDHGDQSRRCGAKSEPHPIEFVEIA